MTTPGGNLRAFTAVPISAEGKRRLAEGQVALRASAPGVAWVRPRNLHVTLHFLGSIAASSVDDWARAIASAASEVEPFAIRVEGVGSFPPKRVPRVLWAGISIGRSEMERLFRRISARLQSLGYRPDRRPYHPHVTLGRIREPRRAEPLAAALARGTGATTFEEPVDCVHLVRSRLDARGSVYDTLLAVPLGEAPTGDHPTDISEDPS